MPTKSKTPRKESAPAASSKKKPAETKNGRAESPSPVPARSKAEKALRDELLSAGSAADSDKLVRALVRAKTAPRLRMPTEVIAPYLETMTFREEETAGRLFQAIIAFWNSVDRDAPRPTAETPREHAEDLLENALSERGRSDDLRAIRRLLRQAVESDPNWWEPHLELADIEFHGFEKENEARVHYGRALECARRERPAAPDPELKPDEWTWSHASARPYLRSLEALADYHVEKGEHDKAKRLLERLLRHDPADPLKALPRLAEVRERVGDRAGAIEAYRRIVRENGASEPSALYSLGRLLIVGGSQKEGVATLWRAALTLPWAAAALLDHPFDEELDPDSFPEIEWIEIGLGYAERTDDLWRSEPLALRALGKMWDDDRFTEERCRAIELSSQLMSAADNKEKTAGLRKKLHDLLDPERIGKLGA